MIYTKLKGGFITLTPQDPTARLMGGRAFYTKTQPEGTEVDVLNVARSLKKLAEDVAANFIGRAEMCDALALALATGEHLFTYGPPGTAKSSVIRQFAEGIGGKFWSILMNPDIARDELVGPIDPAALRNGKYERVWAGMTKADLVFFDEVFKASPQVLNMLLMALEERRASSGEQEIQIPLLSAVSASNEIPDRREAMASYDRFLLRVVTDYLTDMGEFKAMLTASSSSKPISSIVSVDEIRLLAAASEVIAMNPPEEVIDVLVSIRHKFSGHGVSDRRWRKTLKAACGQGLLEGTIVPLPSHMEVARWTLWREIDEVKDVTTAVMDLCDPIRGEVIELESLFSQEAAKPRQSNAERQEATKNFVRLKVQAKKLLDSGRADDYFYRLNKIVNDSQDIIEVMYSSK